jgi:hypothetical protein
MRNVIGLIVGFYLTVALVVFAAAAWSFSTEARWKTGSCANPDWMSWAAYRAIAWPKTYMDDQEKVSDLIDWLLVNYTPFPAACR